MRVFRRSAERGGRVAALFGSGLIGAAIDRALIKQHDWTIRDEFWDWSDEAQRRDRLVVLMRDCEACESVDLVWAAGVSDFGSSEQQMELETAHVAEVGAFARRCLERGIRVRVHLVSSLGGLFEGQTGIGNGTAPCPRRAYGTGKLAQEAALLSLPGEIDVQIYRPSTVYGFVPNGRRGLVATLIAATIAHRPVSIFGSPNTLRDYVYAPDIGDFIARRIAQAPTGRAVSILASGKPTSLAEAMSAIESCVGKRFYCSFDHKPHNALDMTVRKTAIPAELHGTSFHDGVGQVYRTMMSTLAGSPLGLASARP